MSVFKWTRKKEAAALLLAQGYTEAEAASAANVTDRTIRRWKADLDFSLEVDRLSLMVGVSQKAERLRIAMRAVRQKLKDDGKVRTARDLLDWLKFAQSETDGAKIDLASIFEAMEGETETRTTGGDKGATTV